MNNDISLIQGCPGGGKTVTSANIIRSLHNSGRVIVCAGTNVAADNLCIKLNQLGNRSVRVYAKAIEKE